MRAFVFSVLALLTLACGAGDADSASGPPSGSSGAGPGGSSSVDPAPSTLKIRDPGELAAREPVTITVQALPPGVYQVQFSLPSRDGNPLDAVLDRAQAETDEDGYASVQVTAPSSPTTFQLRANVGSVEALQSLTVADGGVATVEVQPLRVNLSALRDITTWTASAHEDTTCAALSGIPPEDGPIPGIGAGKSDAPIIPRVPAGKQLAITLRSGHFIGGCTSVESLAPGPLSSPHVVYVSLLNRPIDLSASSLTLSLTLDAPATSFITSLTEAGQNAKGALLESSDDDVDALLDAMREASGDSRQVFENTRKAEAWDDVVRARFGAGAATRLRDLTDAWLAAGRARFTSSEPAFRGSVTPLPQSAPDGAAAARLDLVNVGGVAARHAGFADSAQVVWSASPDDTVALGTDLYFVRTRLATGLAEAAALDAYPGSADAAEALGAALGCPAIAADLVGAGADDALAYGTCDTTCLEELCGRALRALWTRASDAEGVTPTRLSLAATGKAYVGDAAEVAGLTGTWIGELGSGSTKLATRGNLTGAAPSSAK